MPNRPELLSPPAQTYTNSVSATPRPDGSPARHPLARFGIRWLYAYLVLYTLGDALQVVPGLGAIAGAWTAAMSRLSIWTGKTLLDVQRPMPLEPTGSGDTMIAYVLIPVMAALSLAFAALWYARDRHRDNDLRLSAVVSTYLRLTLAAILFGYGFAKVFQAQFPPLGPDRLVQTLGEMSPMGLVWTFMAFSGPYNLFAGLGEVAGGVLLCFRRTTTLGALVSAGVLANVVALNFMYDVPVKLYSAHLVLLCLVLAAPDLRRLMDLLVHNRATGPRPERPVIEHVAVRRLATGLTAALMSFIAWTNFSSSRQREAAVVAAPATAAFWGVYDVVELRRNNVDVPLLVTDAGLWRRIVFGQFGRATVRLMADSALRFSYHADTSAKALELTSRFGSDSVRFAYARPAPDRLVLSGWYRGDWLTLRLARSTREHLLMSRGFNWVQEQPFNR